MRIYRYSTGAALLASLLWQPFASAAEWQIDPVVALRAGYNDNIRLQAENEVASTEIILSPGVTFSRSTQSSMISSSLNTSIRRYLEESDVDDETATLLLNAQHSMERSSLGLAVNLTRDTTLDSQLDETGLVLGRINRFRTSIDPSWSYSFSERMLMRLEYGYSNLDYEDEPDQISPPDSLSHRGQISLSRIINERSTGNLTLGHVSSENDDDFESRFTYLQAGGSYQFNETLSVSFSGGMRYSESKYPANQRILILSPGFVLEEIVLPVEVENEQDGYVFNASINKNFLRGSLSLGASQDITTAASGFLTEVFKVTLGSTYRLSETLSTGLQAQLFQTETDNPVSTGDQRDYISIAPSLTWAFDRFWRLGASYRYSEQTHDDNNLDAVQNAAYLTLTYDWPRIATSR